MDQHPVMDEHPIQGGVETDRQVLHATETRISSGLMGHLARMQTLPLLIINSCFRAFLPVAVVRLDDALLRLG